MWLTSWLRKSTTSFRSRATARTVSRFRPGLEVLEGRALPATLNVTTPLDTVDTNDGVLSLREAIADANSGDTIVFGQGLTGKVIRLTEDHDIGIAKNLNIEGLGAAQLTIRGFYTRILHVYSTANVSLSGLTLADGKGTDWSGGVLWGPYTQGGAVLNEGTLTISNCTLTNNRGGYAGGAISNVGGTLAINDCIMSNNLAAEGGAIANYSGTITINGSTISNNSASGGSGGGIFNDRAATTNIADSSFSGNYAYWSGGGIFNGGWMTLSSCTVTKNTARVKGGGVYNSGSLTLIDATIKSNSTESGGNGGADLYNEGGKVIKGKG